MKNETDYDAFIVGSELKRSYFDHACSNLKNATAQHEFTLA